MVCHQGRESTVSVEKKISDAYAATTNPITSDDTVSTAVSFINIHYFAAAGSLYGREAKVGLRVRRSDQDRLSPIRSRDSTAPHGLRRQVRARRLEGRRASSATIQHTLKVRVDRVRQLPREPQRRPDRDRRARPPTRSTRRPSTTCTTSAWPARSTTSTATATRTRASTTSSRACATSCTARSGPTRTRPRPTRRAPRCPPRRSRTPPTAYPYFFVDPNDNGVVDAGETTSYNAWTARLLRAAYDYQYAQKDPGAFAHNAKYLIEILYDAIADINAVQPVAGFANLVRNDSGHFDTSAEVYRHWDEDTDHLVDPICARCHSPEGFLFRAKYDIDQTIPAQLSSGMTCETCHETGANFSPLIDNTPARRYIASVTFPVPDDRHVVADLRRDHHERRRGHAPPRTTPTSA